MSSEREWKELTPPVYPEGDYVYVSVFCNKCGGKNRQDQGWRYRDDPEQRAKQEELFRKMESGGMLLMMMLARSGMARLTYECADCRDDKLAKSDGTNEAAKATVKSKQDVQQNDEET